MSEVDRDAELESLRGVAHDLAGCLIDRDGAEHALYGENAVRNIYDFVGAIIAAIVLAEEYIIANLPFWAKTSRMSGFHVTYLNSKARLRQ